MKKYFVFLPVFGFISNARSIICHETITEKHFFNRVQHEWPFSFGQFCGWNKKRLVFMGRKMRGRFPELNFAA
jgi:hypothetical protein